MVTGRAAAEGALIKPPFDCMTRIGARTSHRASCPTQTIEVARDQWRDIRIDDGRAGALELEHLGQHVARQGHEHAGQALANVCADGALVRRIAIGVKEAHRNGFDVRCAQLVDCRIHGREIERFQYGAACVQPFAHAEAKGALDQRLRLAPANVVRQRDTDPAQLQHVAETLGRQQRGARALALENGVGGNRRGMHHFGDIVAGNVRLGAVFGDTVHDCARVIGRRRRPLAPVEKAVGPQEHEVRESAADVDADAQS